MLYSVQYACRQLHRVTPVLPANPWAFAFTDAPDELIQLARQLIAAGRLRSDNAQIWSEHIL
jgi:hypothetical protein